MTDTISGPSAATRVSATVERYDAAMGYCVLDPGDGSPDLFCPRTALDAVGLDILLAGAIVACETVQGRHGPKVSRIRAVVKWFLPSKGYGFLESEGGSPDIFCHISAVEASGRDTLPQGAAVTCETVPGDRGPQVSRILSVEPSAAGDGPSDRSWSFGARNPEPQAGALPPAVMELPGAVKFYDPARGFGFVVPDCEGRKVFVHASVLLRSGMADLQPGQRVSVRAESVPRGLQATDIEPI